MLWGFGREGEEFSKSRYRIHRFEHPCQTGVELEVSRAVLLNCQSELVGFAIAFLFSSSSRSPLPGFFWFAPCVVHKRIDGILPGNSG